MNPIASPPNINVPEDARGEYREMLIRLMTRQIYAETATAEVFGRAISAAPNWKEKELAAEFAAEEARHSRGLYDLLRNLGEDPEKITWEDYDTWLSLVKIAEAFKRVSQTLGYYWNGPENLSNYDQMLANNQSIRSFLVLQELNK